MNTGLIDTNLHECVLVRNEEAARDLFMSLKTELAKGTFTVEDAFMGHATVLGLPVKTLAVVPRNEVWIISKSKNPGQVAQKVDVIRAILEE